VRSFRTELSIVGVLLGFGIWFAFVEFVEPAILENLVTPSDGNIQDWTVPFMNSQHIALAIGLSLAVIWHIVARRSSGRHSDRRILWIISWALCVAASLSLEATTLSEANEGVEFAYILGFLNGLAPFWLGTSWCTAGACKYAPLGAGNLRGAF
jgi:hypothetical protein